LHRLSALALALAFARAGSARADEHLTLREAVETARTKNPSLAQRTAELAAARARVEQAFAAFLPGVGGSVSYQPQTANYVPTPAFRRERALEGRPIVETPTSAQLFNYWWADVGVVWSLFDWGRTYYGWRGAKAAAEGSSEALRAAYADVTLDVKLAYYTGAAAQAAVAVAEDGVATRGRHLEQAKTFYSFGTKTRIDVTFAEAEVASAQLTYERARAALDAARGELGAALGAPAWRAWTFDPPEPDAPADELGDDDTRAAVEHRPDVQALALKRKGAADDARAVRGDYLPQLVLRAGPNWSGFEPSSLTTNFGIILELRYMGPLGMNPFAVRGQSHAADAVRDVAQAQEDEVRTRAFREVGDARARIRAARRARDAAAKLVTAAEERRDLAEQRYKEGAGTLLELSDAQVNYVNARFESVKADADVSLAPAPLDRALGR
jgi:outer membrane protein TolC